MAAPELGGRYGLEDTLSITPMAEVRLAWDNVLDRTVVVKLLAPDADEARFEREARAVAGLGHPNIVQLFDFGATEERPYMVFERLVGGSLEDRLADSARLGGEEVARIAREVAEGLAHAHRHGVIHRDLKPANVLFDAEGRAKIADFGIATVGGAQTLTEPGAILGTAAYISPEQVRGDPVTPAVDVYAFGVVLYRMLAGRLPFEAESPTELARMHRDESPQPLADVDDQESLAAVAMSALAKDPAQRPRDGAALLRRLGDELGPAEAATAVLSQETAPRRRLLTGRRRPFVAGFSAVLLAAGGALAALALTRGHASAPAGPVPPAPKQSVRSTGPTQSQRTTTSATTSSTTPTTTASRSISSPVSTPSLPTVSTATLPETTTTPPATTSTPLTTTAAP